MFENTFSFLKALRENNNREWYAAHKDLYQRAKTEFEHLTEILIYECSRLDASVAGLAPNDCIFRIFRDVRFSKNKEPYKTNFGAFIAPGGRKAMRAGYYLHVEPGACFVAGGIYLPPAEVLRAIRKDIYEHFEEFSELLAESELQRIYGSIEGEHLKLAPKGFPKDFKGIELLKFKSYGLLSSVTDAALQHPDSLQHIVNSFRVAVPFVRFLNEAIE